MFAAKRISSFQDALALLNCRRLPARLSSTETAILLGFQEHDITALIGARLLSPLGKPVANAPKYFAAVDVLELAQNREWLSQATKALSKFWNDKNRRKKLATVPDSAAA